MKHLFAIASTITLAILVACSGNSDLSSAVSVVTASPQKILGLLEVHVEGIGGGGMPTASANFVNSSSVRGGLRTQASTVIPVNGTGAMNDVEFKQSTVNFIDDDLNATRYVSTSFKIINRTTTAFNNLTLYAVAAAGNIGGTGIANMTSATGAPIANSGSVARSFKPTHSMEGTLGSVGVNAIQADLQLFTPTEAQTVKTLAGPSPVGAGILTNADTVLEYGFVARNLTGNRPIAAADSTSLPGCSTDACKGHVTLAYKFPKSTPRANNPWAFNLYFVVTNETKTSNSVSAEEPNDGYPAAGFNPADSVRILGGTLRTPLINEIGLIQLCRVRTAVGPDDFLGPNPFPTTSGSLDGCFGAGGRRVLSNYAVGTSVSIQSDSKIVVGGGSDFAVARFDTSGSLDPTFDGDGIAQTDFVGGGTDFSNRTTVQTDGKIISVGSHTEYVPNYRLLVAVSRSNSDGSPDITFDSDGQVTTAISSGDDIAESVAVQSDGKILVVANTAIVYSPVSSSTAILRFNTNGSLDTTFDSDGILSPTILASVSDIAVQSDGKIVVVGTGINPANNLNNLEIVRLNANGSPDTSFDLDGKQYIDAGPGSTSNGTALAIQTDGKIVVVGAKNSSLTESLLARVNANGSLDLGFGTGGKIITRLVGYYDSARDVSVQADGKILVAGATVGSSGTNPVIVVSRYNADGTLAPFSTFDGRVYPSFPATAAGVATQSDGKIVVASSSIARILP